MSNTHRFERDNCYDKACDESAMLRAVMGTSQEPYLRRSLGLEPTFLDPDDLDHLLLEEPTYQDPYEKIDDKDRKKIIKSLKKLSRRSLNRATARRSACNDVNEMPSYDNGAEDNTDELNRINMITPNVQESLNPQEATDLFDARHQVPELVDFYHSPDEAISLIKAQVANLLEEHPLGTDLEAEHGESAHFNAPTYEIDISECWDTESIVEAFISEFKKLKFYRKGLLLSGFDGSKVGQQWHSDMGEGLIFCTDEQIILSNFEESALEYAMGYDQPAIAVYDSRKMKEVDHDAYKMTDPTALLAICLLK